MFENIKVNKLSLGEVLSGSTSIFLKCLKPIFLITICYIGVMVVLFAIIALGIIISFGDGLASLFGGLMLLVVFVLSYPIGGISAIFYMGGLQLLPLKLIDKEETCKEKIPENQMNYDTYEEYEKPQISIKDIFKDIRSKFWRLVGTSLVSMVIVGIVSSVITIVMMLSILIFEENNVLLIISACITGVITFCVTIPLSLSFNVALTTDLKTGESVLYSFKLIKENFLSMIFLCITILAISFILVIPFAFLIV